MFLSHIDVTLSFSLPLSLKSIKNISSGDDLKKKKDSKFAIYSVIWLFSRFNLGAYAS